MGYYPYVQECIHGHQWRAVFTSYDMRDSGQKRCPECGCYKVRKAWNIPGDCGIQHEKPETEPPPIKKIRGTNLADDFETNPSQEEK